MTHASIGIGGPEFRPEAGKKIALKSNLQSAGHQPRATAEITALLEAGERDQVLLGVGVSARLLP